MNQDWVVNRGTISTPVAISVSVFDRTLDIKANGKNASNVSLLQWLDKVSIHIMHGQPNINDAWTQICISAQNSQNLLIEDKVAVLFTTRRTEISDEFAV